MTKSRIQLVVFSQLLFALPASALDLNGAWTTGGACEKIFAKTENGISFRPDSDLHGSGFIVQGDIIRGRAVRCQIKSRNEKGPVNRINAICSTDIMIDKVQISYKVVNENKITRVIPGSDGFEIEFTRCGALN